jgi:hypothetical protein
MPNFSSLGLPNAPKLFKNKANANNKKGEEYII